MLHLIETCTLETKTVMFYNKKCDCTKSEDYDANIFFKNKLFC